MGLALWIASGATSFAAARLLRSGGALRWPLELLIAIAAAVISGLAATALDFGGWKEPDWRAALFAFFASSAVLALSRLARLAMQHT
jgi:hypothetical protein